MPAYRCYLLNDSDGIEEVVVLDCADDTQAEREGRALLALRPAFCGVEIWYLGRRIHRHFNAGSCRAAGR